MTSTWMRRLVGAGVCALLLLSAPALARPRGGPPAQPAQPADPTAYLSTSEHACRDYGIFVYRVALDRDKGWTLTDVLARSRQWDAEHALDAVTARIHDVLISAVYHDAATPPPQARTIFETACVIAAQAPTPTAPERTKELWR